MNILNYLNSKDVKMYLEKLYYSFAPLDAAKIIENCEHINLNEKHEAFLELIAETEDTVVTVSEEYGCGVKEISLQTLLKNYIEAENDAVRNFYRIEKDFVYIHHNKEPLCVEVYSDFNKDIYNSVNSGIEEKIVFTKKSLSIGAETSVCFDKSGHILWVQDSERFVIPHSVFRFDYKFSENIPSPFVIGDVVIPCGKYKTHPLVITKFGEETISGYRLYNGSLIKSELYLTVADLEFYPEEIAPTLKAVSDYIKGKTELHTFINMYHNAALEEYAGLLLH